MEKEFDLEVRMNGIQSDIEQNSLYSNFESDEVENTASESKKTTTEPKEKDWKDKLENFTDKFKGLVGYEELKNPKQDETGKKVKILGLDPLVLIALSVGLIVASGIAIVVISRKQKIA